MLSGVDGDIFGRDNLDFQSREIATIAALANLDGFTPNCRPTSLWA
jgi:hypothetical protein